MQTMDGGGRGDRCVELDSVALTVRICIKTIYFWMPVGKVIEILKASDLS
jgi:hypothetical protein